MEHSHHRPAGRWREALQRDQADRRRYFAAHAHAHPARPRARWPRNPDPIPDHSTARGLRVDTPGPILVGGCRAAELLDERARQTGQQSADRLRQTEESTGMRVIRLEHVQLAMPAGGEELARAFYRDALGIPETPKPAHLAKRGGCWFERGELKIHLGVEADFRAARKAHPALL